MIGGEYGFSDKTQYNHVYSSMDGAKWNFVTNATFSKRSGHGAIAHNDSIYVIAGYLNLHDLWRSDDLG